MGGRGGRPHGRFRGSDAAAHAFPWTVDPSRRGLPVHGGPEPAPWPDGAAAGEGGAFRAAGSVHRGRSERPVPADVGRTGRNGAAALQPALDAAAPADPVRVVPSGGATRASSALDTSGAPTGRRRRRGGRPVAPEPA